MAASAINKLVIMAGGDFAVPSIQRLLAENNYQLLALITNPPRKHGRGQRLRPHLVMQTASAAGIHITTPERISKLDPSQLLPDPKIVPDLGIVIAYGKILPQHLLDWPRYGCINLHASLLPRWRGADPIRHALMANAKTTGVSVQQMVAQLDAGPVLAQTKLTIPQDSDYANLAHALAAVGARLLLSTLASWPQPAQPQDENKVSFAGKLSRSERQLTAELTAKQAIGRIRAFAPKPGAEIAYQGSIIKIIAAEIINAPVIGSATLAAGSCLRLQQYPALQFQDTAVLIRKLIVPGKAAIDGRAFLQGYRWEGTIS